MAENHNIGLGSEHNLAREYHHKKNSMSISAALCNSTSHQQWVATLESIGLNITLALRTVLEHGAHGPEHS